MEKKQYKIPSVEVLKVNTELMNITDVASIISGPGVPMPPRHPGDIIP